jgi:hypothetical protein
LHGTGTAGIAIAFCSDEKRPYLRDIEKLTLCSLDPVRDGRPAEGPDLAAGAIKQPDARSQLCVAAGSRERPCRSSATLAAVYQPQECGAVNRPLPVRFLQCRAVRHQEKLVIGWPR